MRGGRSTSGTGGQKAGLRQIGLYGKRNGSGNGLSRQQARTLALCYPAFRYFRSRRLASFYSSFEISDSTRVIDVGGNLFFWRLAGEMGLPAPQVTVVNLNTPRKNTTLPGNLTWVRGDGTDLQFPDNSFDIAFCNSVIEHLGNRARQQKLADEIHRVALFHFVQTPNRRFVYEPHMMSLFEHWLPSKYKRILMRNFTGWGLINRPSRDQCEELVEELRLLTPSDMRSLFPDSKLVKERFAGMTKSLLAIKAPRAQVQDQA